MEITKKELMKIIQEELADMAKVSTSDVRKSMAVDTKAKVAGGVNDQERGIIQKLQDQLTSAAASGNITSGRVFRLAQMLSDELLKMSGGEPSPEGEE